MTRRKRYSTEFKREAPRRCKEPGVTAVLVAEELGISTRQLRRWQEAVEKHGDKAFPGEGSARVASGRFNRPQYANRFQDHLLS